MTKRCSALMVFLIFSSLSFGQNLEDLDDLDKYSVDEFYKKVELDEDTLDEDGDEINYIYVKTEVDKGSYKIELTDSDGDLYKVKKSNLYVKFRGSFGRAESYF